MQEYGTGSNGQSFIPSPLSAHPATAALQPPSYASSLLQTQPHSSKTNAETPKVSTVRRDNNRISFFDPANQAVISRLVAGDLGDDGDDDGAEENAQATMLNVEEMLEGYDWASDDLFSRRSTRGAADLVEARLLDELTALEKVGSTVCVAVLSLLTGEMQGQYPLVLGIGRPREFGRQILGRGLVGGGCYR